MSNHAPLSSAQITTRYACFAGIATGANLGVQALSMNLFQGNYELAVAMALGTGVGLVVKFVLDKYWIFYDRSTQNLSQQGWQFTLYTFTGIFTTVIFWGTEILFGMLTEGSVSGRLFGAFVGLSIGYVVKYFLDRKFVFGKATG